MNVTPRDTTSHQQTRSAGRPYYAVVPPRRIIELLKEASATDQHLRGYSGKVQMASIDPLWLDYVADILAAMGSLPPSPGRTKSVTGADGEDIPLDDEVHVRRLRALVMPVHRSFMLLLDFTRFIAKLRRIRALLPARMTPSEWEAEYVRRAIGQLRGDDHFRHYDALESWLYRRTDAGKKAHAKYEAKRQRPADFAVTERERQRFLRWVAQGIEGPPPPPRAYRKKGT